MADGDTQTQPPPDDILQQALAAAAQLQQSGPQPQPVRDTTPTTRSWPSLLGQALAGAPPLPGATDAEKEWMGRKALGDLGTSLMAQSGHLQGGTIFTALGRGLQAAQQGALGSEQFTAANLGAQQEYQQKQQEMRLAALKEAIPLLTLKQKMDALKGLPTTLGGGGTGAPGTSIATGGNVGLNAAGDSATRKAAEGGPPAPGTPGAATAQSVHDFWIGQGYTEAQVAGIMAGGPGSESDFTPTASGDKGTSYGLYQHHGDRLTAMRQYFGLTGDQMPTADQQNQYAAFEIGPKGPLAHVGVALHAAQTPAEAATIWTRDFGVPGDKTEILRRANGAGRFLGPYTPKDGAPAPPAATTAQTPPAPATAPPGVQIGGPPPAPPGSTAPATTYPQVGGGIGRVAAGTEGKAGPEQVTVAPPPVIKAAPVPAGKLLGQAEAPAPPPGSAAEALQAGVQLAQATPGIGTQVAGPPGVVTTPPAPPVVATAAPGVTIGDYNAPRPATTVPPPAPAPQATTQATQPPAGPTPLYVRPPLTPEQTKAFDTTLPPEQMAPLEAAYQTARRQAASTGDMAPVQAAQEALQKAQATWSQQANQARAVYEAKQQELEQAARVKQAEFEQTNQTAAATRAQEERMAVINSANTRLGAEAAKQVDQNAEVDKTYRTAQIAGKGIIDSVDQLAPVLANLPERAAPALQNEHTRGLLGSLFGWSDAELTKHVEAADLFQQGMDRLAAQLSPLAPAGTVRPSMVAEFRSQLPTLAQSASGRELALQYVRDLARHQVESQNWLTEHKEDDAYMNKRLGVPDRDKALIGLERNGPQMPRMPPIPSTFDPNGLTKEDVRTNAAYRASLKPGQPYYAWEQGPDGKLHAVRKD